MKKMFVSLCLACFVAVACVGCGGEENKKPSTSSDNSVHGPGHKPGNMKVKKPEVKKTDKKDKK